MRKILVLSYLKVTLADQRVMRLHNRVLIGALSLLTLAGSAKTIVVNTTNNVSPGPGETSLVMAINLLEDGDSIHFNIPGPGPFYLPTPPLVPDNGYPPITNHNITIDGYSQPGSSPNSNTILSSNNANIQIVLDSREGGAHSEELFPGYSLKEASVFLVKGATNVTFSGLCFLGPGKGNEMPDDPNRYAVSFAGDSDGGHIQGCRFGLDLNSTNIFRFRAAVTAFESPTNHFSNGTIIGVAKTNVNQTSVRAQFNIIIGEYIPIGVEGESYRIAGNFFNLFPDGNTDFNIDAIPPYDMEAFIEIGVRGHNTVIGTDGDGFNDAEERNIFGGVPRADDLRLLEFYPGSGTRTNVIIAGNYFGVGVDGITRFTNSSVLVNNISATSTMRIGSDFDGVSDDLEANLISMNYPFESLLGTYGAMGPPVFCSFSAGARLSLRGNQLIGNNIPPFSFANGLGTRLKGFTNYFAPYLLTNGPIIPALFASSTQARLRGSFAPGKPPYTNIIIDFYLADNEGWTNGQVFQFQELAYTNQAGDTLYYGFAQGRTYLGSFVDNGPEDLDPSSNQFDFDISSLNIPVSNLVTIAANYSADLPGTHNGRTQTSDFAMPINLLPAPRLFISRLADNVLLSWPTNSGLMIFQSSPTLAPPNWTDLMEQPSINLDGTNYAASLPIYSTNVFFRLKY